MKNLLLIFSLGVILFFSACGSGGKTSQSIDIKSLSGDAIIIGTGGGFTGFYDGAVITRSGEVFSWRSKTDSPDELIPMFTTTKDSADFFFRYLDEIGFTEMKSLPGGNMNSFIELRASQGKTHVSWSMDNSATGGSLASFHSLVRKYVQRHTAAKK